MVSVLSSRLSSNAPNLSVGIIFSASHLQVSFATQDANQTHIDGRLIQVARSARNVLRCRFPENACFCARKKSYNIGYVVANLRTKL